MLLVTPRIHTFTFTTYLWKATFLSTPPTVKHVYGKVDTFVVATIRACATFGMANLGIFVTCERDSILFAVEEVACSLKRRVWFFVFRRCC